MIPFRGTVWRLLFAGALDRAASPGPSPEGRFHHSGQPALYTSLTREGCGIAIRRYLRADDAPRVLVPLDIDADRIADLRGAGAASAVWQDIRATGAPAPTWRLSDAARAAGAQGLLYRSRSRPDLLHLALFDVTAVTAVGEAEPWTDPPPTPA